MFVVLIGRLNVDSCCVLRRLKSNGLTSLVNTIRDIRPSCYSNKPEFEQGYPLNLSILLSGGKETN